MSTDKSKMDLGLIAGKHEERKRFVKSANEVADWEVERFVPCHGKVIEGKESAKKVWKDVFRNLLMEEL